MNILIADDDPVSLSLLEGVLTENGHRVTCAPDGHAALKVLVEGDSQVLISDWEMPGMDGLELCRRVRSEELGRYVYTILLTVRERRAHIIEGLSAGADEFMNKPLEVEELTVRLSTAERVLALESRDLVIYALARLAESRDPETGAHLDRVRRYSRILAAEASSDGELASEITPAFVNLIYRTSPLHDIGKVAIPDHVLLKPGRLDDVEYEIMKTHAAAGAATLDDALGKRPEADFLRMARDIAACHHERYDGKGYPAGLAGDEIPLCARIFSVADVYDALVSKRVYKESFSHDVSRHIIVEGSGTQFDPRIVEAFLRCEQRIKDVERDIPDPRPTVAMVG